MTGSLLEVRVRGFRSLAHVDVPLGRLTVLVGPNGSGKSNLLGVLRFLAATIRFDLITAVQDAGGFERIIRSDGATADITIEVDATVTANASYNAPDRYTLTVGSAENGSLRRFEEFQFKRHQGPGRRITVNGSTINIGTIRQDNRGRNLELADEQTTGLSTLPRLAEGAEGIDDFAGFLSSMRVLEPVVDLARAPSRLYQAALAEDASNLADALLRLKELEPQGFSDLQRDMKLCLPGFKRVDFESRGGAARTVVVQLIEDGLSSAIELADASFGTVRLLALLTALYEPEPPPLTAIEEIDHGLHPYALDVVADALRAASERTQLIVASHSPTFVNRLHTSELVICDRDPDSGASLIPAIDPLTLALAVETGELGLGELWFSGALRGVPV